MRLVRSTFFARMVACLLVLSMLPTLVGPASQASGLTAQGAYEVWIRAQLRAPASAELEAALERAAEERSNSIAEFVAALLDAYAEEAPGERAARAFMEQDLTDDALISYLQNRYTEIAPEAVFPRLRPIAPPVATSLNTTGASGIVTAAAPSASVHYAKSTLLDRTELVTPFRILSPARSQGP